MENEKESTFDSLELEINSSDLQAYLQTLEQLRPMDDTFMRVMFRENKPLAEFVLRILLENESLILTHMETQADMKQIAGARSIELDLYGTDQHGTKYNLEVQNSSAGAEAHRLRYHSSVLDVENLVTQEDFIKLPNTYVIFITEKDIYKLGYGKYMVRTQLQPQNADYQDGRHLLYVNGEYRGNNPLGKLMHDFNCNKAEDMYYPLMAERMRYFNENKEGIKKMCKLMDDIREQGIAIGKISIFTIMDALNKDASKTDEAIAEELSCDVETVKETREHFLRIKGI